jgi:hypothetical protein
LHDYVVACHNRIELANNEQPKAAKGKVSKNKSSQKSKNKQSVKVVVQAPAAEASSKNASLEISKATKAMLEPDPDTTWAIPRAFPTDVCPVNYSRTIQIDSGSGVILDATPDLDETLKVYVKPKAVTNVTRRAALDLSTLFIAKNALRMYFKYQWYDATGSTQEIPNFMVDAPNSIVVVPVIDTSGVIDSVQIIPNKRLIYASRIVTYGNQTCRLEFTSGAIANLAQTFNTLDVNLNIVANDTGNAANPVTNTTYTNIVGIAGTAPYFESFIEFTVAAGISPIIRTLSVAIADSLLTPDVVEKLTYGPSPDINGSLYSSVRNSSSKFSFPLMTLLCTYVGSDLLNGGNIAIGVVPYDFTLSLVPEVAYAQICALGGKRYHGPMKDGVHGFYIPDDLTRIAFHPMDEKVLGRRLVVAILPQIVQDGQSSAVTMAVELRSHIEFINAAQTLSHMTARCCAEELLESMFASLEMSNQVGENPGHVERIKDAVKRVAQDPRTKQVATKALSWLGKGAIMAAPLLLG